MNSKAVCTGNGNSNTTLAAALFYLASYYYFGFMNQLCPSDTSSNQAAGKQTIAI